VTYPTIEDIILAHDTRNMSALRPYVPERFVSDAALSVLERPGSALIVTSAYIARASAETDDRRAVARNRSDAGF
jgi:hypothetical protein